MVIETALYLNDRINNALPYIKNQYWLKAVLLISILSPILANDLPLVTTTKEGTLTFPAVKNIWIPRQQITYNETSTFKISCAIPYAPLKSNLENTNLPPLFSNQTYHTNSMYINFFKVHWLGTTKNGSDVLSNLLHGTRVSLWIGIMVSLISSFIGLVIGLGAGFYKDKYFKLSWLQVFLILFSIFIFWFYCLRLTVSVYFHLFIATTICYAHTLLHRNLAKKNSRKRISIPIHFLATRVIEIFTAIPKLILILTLSLFITKGTIAVITILSISYWPLIANLSRNLLDQLGQENYLQSGRLLYLPNLILLSKHALPMVAAVVLPMSITLIGFAILSEASLSYLGMGLASDTPTWGVLLQESRSNFSAWWVAVFPGLVIMYTVYRLYRLGQQMTNVDKLFLHDK
ncbi:MAG: hypothetical protein RIQ89_702 [Bacteroidota bacterium]|jgi:peptide/nickel transport system permease protein